MVIFWPPFAYIFATKLFIRRRGGFLLLQYLYISRNKCGKREKNIE